MPQGNNDRQLTASFFWILSLFLLAWLIFIPLFKLAEIKQAYLLESDSIQHETGCAYVIYLHQHPPGYPITKFASDNASSNRASKLVLLEDGTPFGIPHSLHNDIREKGGGSYSHWDGVLYFSLPGCANPINN